MKKEEKISYIRNKAMYDLKQAGLTHTEIAAQFGVSVERSWMHVNSHRKLIKAQEGSEVIEAQKYNNKAYHARAKAVKLEEIQPDLLPTAEPENHDGPWRCSCKPHDGWRNFINPSEIIGLLT